MRSCHQYLQFSTLTNNWVSRLCLCAGSFISFISFHLFPARRWLLRTFLGSINAAVNHGLQHKHAHTLSCQMYTTGSHPRHLSFCGRNVPDWSGWAQGRQRTIHHISLSLSQSLSFSLPLPVLHQSSLLLHLSVPAAVSSSLYVWRQMQPSSGSAGCSASHFLLSGSLLPHSPSPLFIFLVLHHHAFQFAMCFLPSCSFPRSACTGFSLPFSCFTTSLPLPLLLFCRLSSRAPGLKHAGIH